MRRLSTLIPAVLLGCPALLFAQDTTRVRDTTGIRDTARVRRDSTRPTEKVSPRPESKTPPPAPINFSGVVFGNYQYQTSPGPNHNQNKFDLERAYLTFRMPAGDRASIRVTGDVFQQTSSANDAYYKGWVLRAKYAYLQYDFLKAATSANWAAVARIGLVHTAFIDYEENFWPRWLSQTPVERAGYFSSADAGVAGIVTLPYKYGELYAAITNGPGYTSREIDRFKDYQARLSITPLAGSDIALLRTFSVAGWVYRGTIASKFVNGGTGQVGPVSAGLDRNRYGVFAGIRDPRLTIGLDYAQRSDGGETGANSLLSPRIRVDSTGRLLSAYTVIKPFLMVDPVIQIPLGLVLRYDDVKPNTSGDLRYHTFIGGVTYDLSNKSAISLDYQEQIPRGAPIIATSKTYYLHWVANF